MKKRFLALTLAIALVLSLAACGKKTPANPAIRLATTTSVNDSGLLGYLLPFFEEETGYRVEVASAGTGIAIGYAKSGDADMLLVHSKAQEETFIADGYANTERLSFMYNYFVICGPADDPAGIASADTAALAFDAIAKAKCGFVSRGDNSGTHNKETGIWKTTAFCPDAAPDPAADEWYISVGSGMGDTLNKANEMNAYVLTDKATYLSMKSNLQNLTILKAEASDMKNTYSMIGVAPDAPEFAGKDVKINTEGAKALIDWMLSDKTAELIKEYGKKEYGEQLFYLIE